MKNSLLNEIKRLAKRKGAPNREKYLSLSTEATYHLAAKKSQALKEIEIQALKGLVIPERYQRNMGTIGVEGQIKLLQAQVAIVGMGGLGGAVLEFLLRLGVGKIVAIDGDSFEDSNLNRQFLSQLKNIGKPKVKEARQRGRDLNLATEIEVYPAAANEKNLPEMIRGSQVVVDGLDNIRTRLALEKVSRKMGIPLVHGAIAGFVGQVTTIFPKDRGLKFIFGPGRRLMSGVEKEFGTPCITPALIATWQSSEVIKILLGWENTLRNRLLIVDVKEQVMEIVSLS